MTPSLFITVIAYLVSAYCAVVLVRRRTTSKRLRALAWVLGAMPLMQAAGLLEHNGLLPPALVTLMAGSWDLLVALLIAWIARLVDLESRDSKRLEYQLRLVESDWNRSGLARG